MSRKSFYRRLVGGNASGCCLIALGFQLTPFMCGPARTTTDVMTIGAGFIFGLLLAVAGCSLYLQDKSQPAWLASAGFIPVLGVVLVFLLPDKSVPRIEDGPRGFDVLPPRPVSPDPAAPEKSD